jgi:CheY-like chemotaxis protein
VIEGALVLIVDDEERNRKLARDVLQFHGFRTVEAANAPDAIELAAEHQPSVVLMDVRLPGMDGIEATGILKGDPKTAAIAVVALTAFAMKGDRERFLAAGFDGYLSKPIDVKTFAQEVARYCGPV